MAERDTCLVVSASTWFEVMGGTPAPGLSQHEYKVRCRLVVEGQEVVMALLYELADGSGGFRRLIFGPELRTIPRFKIIREEPWERDAGGPS